MWQLPLKSQCFFTRLMTFAAILRQECGWFDRKENAVEILSSHLSGDAANVQNVCKHTKFIRLIANFIISNFLGDWFPT